MHYLVHRLREFGVEAYVSPIVKEYPFYPKRPAALGKMIARLRGWNRLRRMGPFYRHPAMNVPLAPATVPQDAIVVYPETVAGNPLGATHIVRWLLHRPNYLNKDAFFTKNELTFFYQTGFVADDEQVDPSQLLRLRWLRDDVYRNHGQKNRQGACRLIRKGALHGVKPDKNDPAVLLDGMSHEQMAEVFNQTEIMYCHDPYTLYCGYAVMCGCVPIIAPQDGLSSDQWRDSIELKFGVAYDEKELDWARETAPKLLAIFEQEKRDEDVMVANFIEKLITHFEPQTGA